VAHDHDKPENAKQALADYYDDIFGSMSSSPLSGREVESSQTAEPVPGVSKATTPKSTQSQQEKTAKATVFAEPEVAKKIPTLAPPKIKPATVEKVEVKTQTALQTEAPSADDNPVEAIAKPKNDLDSAPPALDTQTKNTQLSEASTATETTVSDQKKQIQKPADWLANGRPQWAQDRFECLLFSVAGLKLAVPLVSLGSIHRIESEFTPLVGRADWFLGLYRTGERNIQVVDTAKWVMPEQYHARVIDGYDFVIRLGDSNWGVACDSVAQAITLEPEQVRWRTERSKRAWLSGTVIDHMCALLDADMLNYMLEEDAIKGRIKKGH